MNLRLRSTKIRRWFLDRFVRSLTDRISTRLKCIAFRCYKSINRLSQILNCQPNIIYFVSREYTLDRQNILQTSFRQSSFDSITNWQLTQTIKITDISAFQIIIVKTSQFESISHICFISGFTTRIKFLQIRGGRKFQFPPNYRLHVLVFSCDLKAQLIQNGFSSRADKWASNFSLKLGRNFIVSK